MQVMIIRLVQPRYENVLVYLAVFNPCSIFGGGIQNIGAFNDTIFYIVLYLSIKGHWLAKAASALASYFDPRIIFIIFPMEIFRSRSQNKNDYWQSLLQQIIYVVMVWLVCSSRQSLQNAYNILMVEDPSINMGSFWYMMAEMFKDHLLFLKLLYILQQSIMCIFTTIHITSTFNAIDMSPEK